MVPTMKIILLVFASATISADLIDSGAKLKPGLRYQYVQGKDGTTHLVDLWVTVSDVANAERYDADSFNTYHLFTRENPTVSQPLLIGNDEVLAASNYRPGRRTVVLIHGWLDTITSDFNTVLIPALLGTGDVNVISVDWSHGSSTINFAAAVANTPVSGVAVAKFISWINVASGAALSNYHIIGHSLGAHQAGIVGRHLGGLVDYITALDPAFPGWITNEERFRCTDGVYTEVIHTNAGLLGYPENLGHVDFYPNGGVDMPGCISQECDHARSYFYMAESVWTGGFSGTRCSSYLTAMAGQCFLWGSIKMGGILPKTGQTGIFHLHTNMFPPFSRG